MNKRMTVWMLAAVALAGMTLSGCAQTDAELPEGSNGPKVQSVAKRSFAVGEVFEMTGRNFVETIEGRNFMRITGKFRASDGVEEDVNFEVPVEVVETAENGSQVLAWTRLGPFANPFSAKGRTGVFTGSLRPMVETNDGQLRQGSATDASFAIEPSIEFLEFQPIGADCGLPALSGFGGLPYQVTVRAMGFVPKEFRFRVTALQGSVGIQDTRTFTVPAAGPSATLGDDMNLVFMEVPADLKYYVAAIEVTAVDAASGGEVESLLPINVHRPIEIEYNGNYQVAEYYEPEPVTACIPGAVGNRVTYSETRSQTVQQGVSMRISRNWSQSRGVSVSENWNEGYGLSETEATSTTTNRTTSRTEGSALRRGQSYNESEANNFTYGTSNAENWNTSHNIGGEVSVEVGAEGGASIPLVAEGKVSASTRVSGRYGYTTGQGGSTTDSRNWGSTNSRGTSESIDETYTLNNSVSDSRSFTDSTSRTNSRTYAFGGSATQDERVSEGMSEAEGRTWSESSTSSTLTAYSGFIPVGKFGVFYRQTIRLVRVAQIVTYDACGQKELMGEMLLNEWKWAPDLATGDTCDAQLPPSNLPPAQCLVPPCD